MQQALSQSTLAVECVDVRKTYRQGGEMIHALDGVTLQIAAGSFVSISGPSGSGKSTLLNLIGGLDTPTSGQIITAGRSVHSMTRSERAALRLNSIGFVFQAYNLIPVLTAQENVEFVMQLQGVAQSERNRRSKELLASVGLDGLNNRRPNELSGGQQQRVAVARAIVAGPELVLADEPTANLDSKTAYDLLELMRTMNQERGVTFIFSTHDELVMSFAQRLIKLQDGQIVSDELQS